MNFIHRNRVGLATLRLAPSAIMQRIRNAAGKPMADMDQPTRLRWRSQLELFGGEPSSGYGLDPNEMRAKLHALLAEARAAQTMPWPPMNAKLYRQLFPQMTFWLPEEEGAQLRFEFETEMARLDAAA
jgi:hypothetical protein